MTTFVYAQEIKSNKNITTSKLKKNKKQRTPFVTVIRSHFNYCVDGQISEYVSFHARFQNINKSPNFIIKRKYVRLQGKGYQEKFFKLVRKKIKNDFIVLYGIYQYFFETYLN